MPDSVSVPAPSFTSEPPVPSISPAKIDTPDETPNRKPVRAQIDDRVPATPSSDRIVVTAGAIRDVEGCADRRQDDGAAVEHGGGVFKRQGAAGDRRRARIGVGQVEDQRAAVFLDDRGLGDSVGDEGRLRLGSAGRNVEDLRLRRRRTSRENHAEQCGHDNKTKFGKPHGARATACSHTAHQSPRLPPLFASEPPLQTTKGEPRLWRLCNQGEVYQLTRQHAADIY